MSRAARGTLRQAPPMKRHYIGSPLKQEIDAELRRIVARYLREHNGLLTPCAVAMGISIQYLGNLINGYDMRETLAQIRAEAPVNRCGHPRKQTRVRKSRAKAESRPLPPKQEPPAADADADADADTDWAPLTVSSGLFPLPPTCPRN